jgi:N-acetylmuramoyl-L-alanine amidase
VLLPFLWLLQVAQPATQPPTQPPTRPARPSAQRTAAPAPPATPGTILVRAAGGVERPIALLVERDAGMVREFVRADQLVSALGGALTEDASGRFRLRLPGATLALRDGVAFAVAGEGAEAREYPLVHAAYLEGERLWVPVQLLSDVLPRVAPELSFDADRRAFAVGRRPAPGAAPRVVATREPVPEPVAAPASAPDSAPASVRLPTIIGPRRSAPAPAAADAPPRSADETSPATPESGLARRLVVVDAGHGGPDGGMRGPIGDGPRVVEKNVTLAVSLALREALRARGVGVVMTRTTDTLIALHDRGRIANQRQGDLFVSIHVNAANPAWRDPGATRGFETYFLSEAQTADDRRVADLENESVKFEGAANGGRDDPLSFIMRDMAQNEHLRGSSELASMVQRRLARAHPGPSRGVRQAGFRVLVSAFMPAVLVEVGYGSSPADAAFITSAAGQREIAEAVADAAVEYLKRYEQRVRAAGRP